MHSPAAGQMCISVRLGPDFISAPPSLKERKRKKEKKEKAAPRVPVHQMAPLEQIFVSLEHLFLKMNE